MKKLTDILMDSSRELKTKTVVIDDVEITIKELSNKVLIGVESLSAQGKGVAAMAIMLQEGIDDPTISKMTGEQVIESLPISFQVKLIEHIAEFSASTLSSEVDIKAKVEEIQEK